MEKKNIASFFAICALLCIFLPRHCFAEDLSLVDMLGVRGGVRRLLEVENITISPYEEISVYAPYIECFISSGLKRRFVREISLGFMQGLDVAWGEDYFDQEGNIWRTWAYHKVYLVPISLGFKFYGLSSTKESRWQPYIGVGGGLVLGIEKGSDEYRGSYSETHFTFGWHVGGGIECILGRILGHVSVIGLDFKYRGVNFKEEIGGLKDYSGPEVTIGLSSILK